MELLDQASARTWLGAAVARRRRRRRRPDEPLSEATRALYDRASLVVSGEVSFAEVRRLFAEDDTLRTPDTVTCFAPFNGESRVTLRR